VVANLTSYHEKTTHFLEQEKPDIFLAVEHRQVGEKYNSMMKGLAGIGYKVFSHPAVVTLRGGKSAGAMILCKKHLHMSSIQVQDEEVLKERCIATTLRLKGVTLLVIVAYLFDGINLGGCNLALMAAIGRLVSTMGLPFLLAGDFNMDPETLERSGWAQQLGGTCLATGLPYTCRGGAGKANRILDYIMVSSKVLPMFTATGAAKRGPWRPHLGLTFLIESRPRQLKVLRPYSPKDIPKGGRMANCLVEGRAVDQLAQRLWQEKQNLHSDQEALQLLEELGGTSKQDSLRMGAKLGLLFSRVEVRLALQAGVTTHSLPSYVGRGRSPSFRKVPLVARKPKTQPWGSPALVSWSALAGRLQDLAAAEGCQEEFCLKAVRKLRVEEVQGMDIDTYWWEEKLAELPHMSRDLRKALADQACQQLAQVEQQSNKEIGSSWREWVTQAQAGIGRGCFAWLRKSGQVYKEAEVLSRDLAHEGAQDSSPQAVIEDRQAFWQQLWQRDKEDFATIAEQLKRLRPLAQAEAAMRTKITPRKVREAIGVLRLEAGQGMDSMPVWMLRSLDQQELEALASLLEEVEAAVTWPIQALAVAVALLDKEAGGDRPIALTTMLYRIWGKVRFFDGQHWDSHHAGDYDQALEGRGVLPALYQDELEHEAAVASGKEVLGMLLDLTKYYDQVSLLLLLQDGVDYQFPLHLLCLSIQMYLAPRRLSKHSTFSEAIRPFNSILAGCGRAVSMARLYLLGPVAQLKDTTPSLRVREFVDDFAVKAIGKKDEVRVGLVDGLTTFLDALKKKKCSISTKTEIIGNIQESRLWLVRKLKKHSAEFGFQQARSSRDLGIDTSAGARRTVKVQRKRLKAAQVRGRNFNKLLKLGKGHKKYFMASVQAKSTWGLQVLGVPPGLARKLTADLARAAGGSTGAGRCPISVVAYHFGLSRDPEVRTKIEQVKLFVEAMQASPQLAEDLDKSWGHYKERARTAKSVWGKARGPAQSLMAGLSESGWKLHTPTFWEAPDGQKFKMVRGDPLAPFLSIVQHFEEKRLWQQASLHHGGKGLEDWPDLGPLRSVAKQLNNAGEWQEAGALVALAMGAAWSSERRYQAGYLTSPTCSMCPQGLTGDLHHELWTCLSVATREDLAGMQHLTPEAACAPEAHQSLWLRAIPSLSFLAVPPVPEQSWKVSFPGPCSSGDEPFSGTFCTDGSGGNAPEPSLRRVGWAYVQAGPGSSPGEFGWCSFGSVAGIGILPDPSQTVPMAEMTALLEVAKDTQGDITVFTDHLNLVKQFNRGPQAKLVGPLAGLWAQFWEGEASKARIVKVMWLPSHVDQAKKAVKVLEGTPFRALVANFVADELAGLAASMAQVSEEQQQECRQKRAQAQLVAKRLAKVALAAALHHKAQQARAKENGQAEESRQQGPNRRQGLVARLRASSHTLRTFETSRGLRWRCTTCLAVVRKGSHHFNSFATMPCPGNPRGRGLACQTSAFTRVHGTHRITALGDIWVCNSCGASASEVLRGLGKPCAGAPRTTSSRTTALHQLGVGFTPLSEQLEVF